MHNVKYICGSARPTTVAVSHTPLFISIIISRSSAKSHCLCTYCSKASFCTYHKPGQQVHFFTSLASPRFGNVVQVAVGRRDKLKVFGSDYDTRDGTCIRDYLHVCDLADAHVAALKKLLSLDGSYGCKAINLGTGTGTSVLEMVAAFSKAAGKDIPFELSDRRKGDTVAVWADTKFAEAEIGWTSKLTIDDMCRD